MPERIDRLVDDVRTIREDYRKWGRRTFWILLAMAVAWIVGGAVSLWLVGENGERSDDIQQSRREVTIENCQQQNERNLRTKWLVRHSEELRPASKQIIVTIIDELVPYQRCEQQADRVDLDQ